MTTDHGMVPTGEIINLEFPTWGDGIRPGNELDRVDAVDIHPTVARLLGIAPGEPVDGTVSAALPLDPS